MSLIEDCIAHIEEVVHLRAVSGLAYPRAQAAIGILKRSLRRILIISHAALWGEPQLVELIAGMKEIASLSVDGQPSEELIDASSLGTPDVVALRSSVSIDLVKRVIQRAQVLEASPQCPACGHNFKSTDHDPFCSSCVDAGWDLAWVRGYSAGVHKKPESTS